MPCYDNCLDGTAPPGFSQARAKQVSACCPPFPGGDDHEVVDLAGEAAGVVDRRRGGQGRDEESGQLASLFGDQRDGVAAGDKAGQVRAVLVVRVMAGRQNTGW